MRGTLSGMAQPEIHGSCVPAFERVHEAFAANFTERGEIGAAVAVHHQGELVVDLWAGVADGETGRAWEQDTIAHVYSVTKALAAACALVLVDRGALALDARVADIWPEY